MAEAASQDDTATAPDGGREAVDPAALLAATALLLCAFPVVAVGFSHRPGPYVVQTYLFWSDLPLMALGLLRLPALVRWAAARRLDIVTALVVLVSTLTITWAAHPSVRGMLQVLRLLGVAGAVVTASRVGGTGRRLLVGALAVFTVAEVVLAVGQRAKDGPVGLRALGEQADPLVPIGGTHAPQGTLIHPYVLAGLAIVTIAVVAAVAVRAPARARACGGVAAVAGVAVGFTYSRSAVIAVVGLLVPLVVALRSRATRAAALTIAAAVVVGAGTTALLASEGWVGRAEEAATGENLTRGRGELAGQAVALVRKHPILGVGPGRYVLAVEADASLAAKSTRTLQPVHVVPLLLVAEGGLLVGAALLLLAVALVKSAIRAGPVGWAILLCYTPFLLLDHFPVTFPQGLAITAAWLAALVLAEATWEADATESDAADHASSPSAAADGD